MKVFEDVVLKFHWYEEKLEEGIYFKKVIPGNRYEVIIPVSQIFLSHLKLGDKEIGYFVFVKGTNLRMWVSKTTYEKISELLFFGHPGASHNLTLGEEKDELPNTSPTL